MISTSIEDIKDITYDILDIKGITDSDTINNDKYYNQLLINTKFGLVSVIKYKVCSGESKIEVMFYYSKDPIYIGLPESMGFTARDIDTFKDKLKALGDKIIKNMEESLKNIQGFIK